MLFQSTRSAGSATNNNGIPDQYEEFQSTRSAGSATTAIFSFCLSLLISIHALRRERDHIGCCGKNIDMISIHALRRERDAIQFTFIFAFADFNPRAPQGARQVLFWAGLRIKSFQSTRSAGSATHFFAAEIVQHQISIHALRRERDSKSGHKRALLRCIHNDYSPHMCFFLMFTSTNLIQLDF